MLCIVRQMKWPETSELTYCLLPSRANKHFVKSGYFLWSFTHTMSCSVLCWDSSTVMGWWEQHSGSTPLPPASSDPHLYHPKTSHATLNNSCTVLCTETLMDVRPKNFKRPHRISNAIQTVCERFPSAVQKRSQFFPNLLKWHFSLI